jgi:hypothetical protein
MEHLPPLAAQAPHPAGSRRDRQRRHQHEGQETSRDEAPLDNVVHHALPVEEVIEHDVRENV